MGYPIKGSGLELVRYEDPRLRLTLHKNLRIKTSGNELSLLKYNVDLTG